MTLNSDWKMRAYRRRLAWTSCYVMLGIILSLYVRSTMGNLVGNALEAIGLIQTPRTIAERHLKWAEKESAAGEREVAPVREFFKEARQHTRQFAEATLSFESKSKLIWDFVTRNVDHSVFLRERFSSLVFSQEELDQLVEGVVAGYIRHLEDVESQLLVRMKADLANLPEGTRIGALKPQELATRLDTVMHDAIAATQTELRNGVGLEIASYIAGEIVTQATLQLATSSGILGTGAVSGPMTFGVSVVVGFIVDQIVSEIYNQAFDPAGELSDKLSKHLAEMERLVIEGTPQSPGLIGRLGQFSQRRGTARRQAIQSTLVQQTP